MYTKQEISRQKQAFWTAFGRYMKPILSADGEEISWLNYKTGNKFIHFRMDADTRQASISIVIDHPESETRSRYIEKLKQLKPILEDALEEDDWTWQEAATDDFDRPIAIISRQLKEVNFFRNTDWPAIISFLKPRIIALDNFWSMVRYQFSAI